MAWLLALLCGAPVHARYEPQNYKPFEFDFADGHLQMQFLEPERDWERVDVWVPREPTDAKLPCIVVLYGGGYGGKVANGLKKDVEKFLRAGYVVAMPDYVLKSQPAVPNVLWDHAAAIRWLRSNASRFRIDPERMGMIGYSAGGWSVGHMLPADSSTLQVATIQVTPKDRPTVAVPTFNPRPLYGHAPIRLQGYVSDWGAARLRPGKREPDTKFFAVNPDHLGPDDGPILTCAMPSEGTPSGPAALIDAGGHAEVARMPDVKSTHVPGFEARCVRPDGSDTTWGDVIVDFFDRHVKRPTRATAPELHPHGGPVHEPTDVTIVTVHGDGVIRYTLDGSEPTAMSTAYGGPVRVEPGQTLRARVIVPGLEASGVATAHFRKVDRARPRITDAPKVIRVKVGEPYKVTFAAEHAQGATWVVMGKMDNPKDNDIRFGKARPLVHMDGATLMGRAEQAGVQPLLIVASVEVDKATYLSDVVRVLVIAE